MRLSERATIYHCDMDERTYSMVNSPPYEAAYIGLARPKERCGEGKRHTANTRNNEDLPAFCSPIMVTSISVALRAIN